MDDKKYNLTESKFFCMAPWIHMHVWPNGRAFPCCLADPAKGDYGNTNESTLKELWNSDVAKKLRVNMLADKPHPTCTRCYRLEADGDAHTLRINMNKKFGEKHYSKTLETQQDGTHNNVNFTYMDFRFSNLCNMSCRSCSPTFSTQWYDDFMKKFGEVPNDIAPQKFIQLKNKKGFEEELWPYLNTVEEVYWAGGEPLVTDMHWKIMNYWIETNRAHEVNVLYTTNFSQLTYKRQNVLDLWKKFKSVECTASLDGMGSRAEYIRKGTVWSDIVANRQLMMEQTPNINFDITPTVSCMNVYHLPDFHEDWVNKGLLKVGQMRINNLLDPDYFCMQVLPKTFKDKITAKWEQHIHWVQNHPQYDSGQNFVRSAEGMLNFLHSEDRSDLLEKTIHQLEEWDPIRHEDWRVAIPELAEALA